MPTKPRRPCRRPGCTGLTDGTLCSVCGTATRRASAAARGYDRRWQRYRAAYLARHPLCVQCEAKGHTREATVVDHVTPVYGKHDPLFYAEHNHQALCTACHNRKTGKWQ